MSLAIPSTSTNPLISELEASFAKATTPIEWMVIADTDPRLLQALKSSLDTESSAILQYSQTEWDLSDQPFAEMIDWALNRNHIKHLVLASSSASQLPQSSVSVTRTSAKTNTDSNYEKLMAGVGRSQLRNRELQDRFADQVQQLFEIPLLNHRWASSKLAVYGLLYRADSGIFLAYDNREEAFHPVTA